MIRPIVSILVSAALFSAAITVIGQGANAALSGTIVDPSGAAVAGVTLTLQNTQTGVDLKTSSNETGVYRFGSVQPGRYRLIAEQRGFQIVIYNDLNLEIAAQINLPLPLTLAPVAQTVEVTADLRLATRSASVGTLLKEN